MEFLRAGGLAIWFVILFGGITLVAAVRFASRADLRKLAFIRGMTWATVFSIVSGVLANFLGLMRFVASRQGSTNPDPSVILLEGLGEIVTPGVLGFAMLAIAWFIVAVGTRRAQEQGD